VVYDRSFLVVTPIMELASSPEIMVISIVVAAGMKVGALPMLGSYQWFVGQRVIYDDRFLRIPRSIALRVVFCWHIGGNQDDAFA
jgi:hypothetical protein